MDERGVNDPAGFLERAPVLEALRKDRAVDQALRRGDGQALYDALRQLVKQKVGTTDAAEAARLLTQRRLFMPVFPLSQYVVRAAGGRSYNFYGKVPLSGVARTWRRIVGAAAALAIAGGALASAHSARTAHLQLVNGLDVPVVVSVDEDR